MDSVSHKSDILSLPLELFRSLIDTTIIAVGLHDTTALRLVNKVFDEEVVQSVFRGGYLKPKTGRYDERIPRNFYIRYILWRLESPRGQRSAINAALNASIDLYESRSSKWQAMRKLSREELMRSLIRAMADHVPMKRLRLQAMLEQRTVNARRAQQGALVLATSVGAIEAVRIMLKEGAHANYGTVHLARPLVAACRTGHQAMVELLLDNGAMVSGIAKCLSEGHATTPLQAACEGGHTKIVEILLDRADSDRDFDMDLEGCLAIESCIKAREHVILCDIYNRTRDAAFCAITRAGYQGNVEVVNFLLDNAERNAISRHEKARRCMVLAARNGRVALVKEMLKRDAYRPDRTADLGLYLAIAYRRHEVVELLLAHGGFIDASYGFTEVYGGYERDFYGTPVVVAAKNNDCRMLQILIDHGADLRLERQGEKALERAKENSCSDAVQFLIKAGVRVKEKKKKRKSKSLLSDLILQTKDESHTTNEQAGKPHPLPILHEPQQP